MSFKMFDQFYTLTLNLFPNQPPQKKKNKKERGQYKQNDKNVYLCKLIYYNDRLWIYTSL